ncbi:MAG: MaoC family dehydratase [Mangrovicoccus sp.]|nr:MaoC family dehydratase [Mangrovicoccus sp.]
MSVGTVYLEDLEIGMSRSITKIITLDMIEKFADVSEDRNPIHLDEAAGKASIFGERIAHGMLCASLFSALLGERLPGHGTIYMGQNLKFLAPVKIGQEVTASVTVNDILAERKRVTLTCEATVNDKLVITGEATVMAPSKG